MFHYTRIMLISDLRQINTVKYMQTYIHHGLIGAERITE